MTSKHVMLDIETMGNSTNAAIMSVGACYFDPSTGEIGDTFHQEVNLETSVKAGMVMDVSTVMWWMKQSDEARSKFYDNDKAASLSSCLCALRSFICKDCQVWGNGIAFDNIILRNAYETDLTDTPWPFWNDRDVRTMVELGLVMGIDPKRDMPFEGVKHEALADAIHQAKYVSVIWQKITGGNIVS